MKHNMRWIAVTMICSGLMACGGGGSDDDPPSGGPSGGVAEAKALVAEVRTIAGSTDGLEQPMDMFGQQIQTAADSTEVARECVGSRLGDLAQAIGDCYDTFADPNGDDTPTYNGPTSCAFMSTDSGQNPQTANIVITPNTPAGHDKLDIDGRVADSTVALDAVAPRETSQNNNAITTLTASLAGMVESVGCGAIQARMTLGNASGPAGLVIKKVANPQNDPGNREADVDEADFTGPAKLESLGGANPVTIEGLLAAGVLRCTSTACGTAEPVFNLDAFRLSGTVRDVNESESVSLDWSMSNGRSFNPNGPLTSTNFIVGAFGITANVSLAGQPAQQASVTVNLLGASNPAVGEEDGTPVGNVTAVLTRATMVVTLIVENAAANPEEISRIIARNESGAEMIFTPASGGPGVIGAVTVDGVQVGTLEETSDGVILIRYIDGTFETLG